jgi:hypothetical protein
LLLVFLQRFFLQLPLDTPRSSFQIVGSKHLALLQSQEIHGTGQVSNSMNGVSPNTAGLM